MSFAAGMIVGKVLSDALVDDGGGYSKVVSDSRVRSHKRVPVSGSVEDVVRRTFVRGKVFSLLGRKHTGKKYVVLNVTSAGFQYGEEVDGKYPNPQFLRYGNSDRILFS